eukprot:TRINITY_DN2650_c0_g1_i1.p1 TRINITY_DN2650_c0_g1~~TRINITY_DN2650_c0_g1_i1.p1  ORF type:complete len:856 (+),score=267.63 TRINITY_DN2650_c0_g1_i1:142-2709(+)
MADSRRKRKEPSTGMEAASQLEEQYEATYGELRTMEDEYEGGEHDHDHDMEEKKKKMRQKLAKEHENTSGMTDKERLENVKRMLAEKRARALLAQSSPERTTQTTTERVQEAPAATEEPERHLASEDFHFSESSFSDRLGPEDEIPVHERLFQLGIAKRMQKEGARRKAEEEPVGTHAPSVTRLAKNLRREGQVEELLMKRSDEYKAHLEELRRQREAEELKSLTAPKINPVSKSMRSSTPAHERLYEFRKHTLAKREILKQGFEEKEKKTLGNPEINPISKGIHRSIGHFYEWEERKKKKAVELKARLEAEEQEAIRPHPKLSKMSKKLVEHMDRSGDFGERMLRDHEEGKKRIAEKREKAFKERQMHAKPTLSAHSANLLREGDVVDRLYTLSQKKSKKDVSVEEDDVEEVGAGRGSGSPPSDRDEMRDPRTGQKLFSPFINPRSAALIRDEPIEDILIRRGEDSKRRYEDARKEQLETSMHESMTALHLGPYSRLLSTLLDKREAHKGLERLLEPKGQLRPRTVEMLEEERSRYSFTPRINDVSKELDRAAHGSVSDVSRQDLLFMTAQSYQRRKKILQDAYQEKELEGCTFKPQPTSPQSPHARYHRHIDRRSFVERNSEWVKRLDKKIEKQREHLQKKELEECTFHPHIDPKSRRLSTPRSKKEGSITMRSATPPPRRVSEPAGKGSYRASTPPPMRITSSVSRRKTHSSRRQEAARSSRRMEMSPPVPRFSETMTAEENVESDEHAKREDEGDLLMMYEQYKQERDRRSHSVEASQEDDVLEQAIRLVARDQKAKSQTTKTSASKPRARGTPTSVTPKRNVPRRGAGMETDEWLRQVLGLQIPADSPKS